MNDPEHKYVHKSVYGVMHAKLSDRDVHVTMNDLVAIYIIYT